MTELYLDNAVTTKPYPEVIEVMMDAYKDWWNPNSSYEPAIELREKINEARRVIADSINADPEEIYFTSGGSEGNCWLLHQNWQKVYYSPTEHHSIMAFLSDKHDFETEELEVDRIGSVDWIEFSEIVETDWAGSACNEGSKKPSHVLKAIGLSDEDAARTLRFTLPEDVTNEQISTVVQILKVILLATGGQNE